ncbi:MAG: alpha/beta fold hydrolase [Trebonia sp.]
MLTPGWHQVKLDGVNQAYEVVGEGPVVFAHSGGPGVDSDYLRMPLLERHMTMVYLDPIGTGKSGLLPGGDYSVAEYARRVELLRAHLGVMDGFLLGHSHGGFVALQYALDFPGRMRGFLVYDGAPTYSSDLVEELTREVAIFAKRWPDRPEAVAAVRALEDEGKVHDAASATAYMKTILPLYFADYRKTVKELGKPPVVTFSVFDPDRKPYEWDVRGKLGAIGAPVLTLVGTHDFICPPVWAKQINAEIPNSRLIEFTDSGHLPHVEEPEKFLRSVHGFVSDVNEDQD